MFSWNIWPSETTAQTNTELHDLRFLVKRDIQDSDEEAVRVKEQSILELGGLLAKTGQAAGKSTSGEPSPTSPHSESWLKYKSLDTEEKSQWRLDGRM